MRPFPSRAPLPLIAGSLLAMSLWVGTTEAGRGADGRFDQRKSSHFVVLQDVDIDRYSGRGGSREFERSVLETLERAYAEVDRILDMRPQRDIEVRIYDPELFDAGFDGAFGFRAAGFYDGVIHVRGSTAVDARLVRTLHHEYVHAAIDAAGGGPTFPGWLNEGLAEYLEHRAIGVRGLSPGAIQVLRQARDDGTWIPLAHLSAPSFGHLRAGSAALAYLQSYGIVAWLASRHGDRSLEDLCERLLSSRSLERAIDRTYRKDLRELEAEFQLALH